MDFTEFLARDYDDIRMPVDALKFRVFNDFAKLEVVFVPLFQSFIYPTDPENPWSILPAGGDPVTNIAPAEIPEPAIRNSEFGGRVSFYLSGFDISLVSLYTWNKLPADLQNILYVTAADYNELLSTLIRYDRIVKTEKMIKEHGLELTYLPPEEQRKLVQHSMTVADTYAAKDADFAEALAVIKDYLRMAGVLE